MKLLGFMKDGKGVIHETGELSPTFGSIDVVKELDNGVTVVEIHLGQGKLEALWPGRKPKQQPDEPEEFSE